MGIVSPFEAPVNQFRLILLEFNLALPRALSKPRTLPRDPSPVCPHGRCRTDAARLHRSEWPRFADAAGAPMVVGATRWMSPTIIDHSIKISADFCMSAEIFAFVGFVSGLRRRRPKPGGGVPSALGPYTAGWSSSTYQILSMVLILSCWVSPRMMDSTSGMARPPLRVMVSAQ